jgi:hypothetical protein
VRAVRRMAAAANATGPPPGPHSWARPPPGQMALRSVFADALVQVEQLAGSPRAVWGTVTRGGGPASKDATGHGGRLTTGG